MSERNEQDLQAGYEKLEKLLFEMMNILNNFLLDYEKDCLNSLITHNEGGIAFEDMISSIKFHKISLTKSDFEIIQSAGELMGFPEEGWASLYSE